MRYSLFGILTLASGLGLRAYGSGALAKYGGVALWAVLVYFLVRWTKPTTSRGWSCAVCIAISIAIEFFQLTPIPSLLYESHSSLALVFGTTFHVLDLPAYLLGAVLAMSVDSQSSRVHSQRDPRE